MCPSPNYRSCGALGYCTLVQLKINDACTCLCSVLGIHGRFYSLSSKENIFMLSVDIKYGDIVSIIIVFLH